MKKRGFFFTIDALLGTMILILGVLTLSAIYINEQPTDMLQIVGVDLLQSLDQVSVNDLNSQSPLIQQLVADGNITNVNNSILIQIGEFWSENNYQLARDFAKNITEQIVPKQFGFSILMDNDLIYERNISKGISTLSVSRKIISGLSKFVPFHGFASQIRLDTIRSKRSSSIKYFGGFVGQGNISVFIDDIPLNATLKTLELELDAGSRFNLTINDKNCNFTYVPSIAEMTANYWDITNCSSTLVLGAQNNFSINFLDDISDAFIGGGFIKAIYETDELWKFINQGNSSYYFPGINGIINIYSSFDVPGNLRNMSIKFHYTSDLTSTNNSLYLMIGDTKVIAVDNSTGEDTILLNDSYLRGILNYNSLSLETVPIRVGFENASFQYFYEGFVDVGVITDLSGSMNWRMDVDSVDGVLRNCDDPSLDDLSTRRLSIGKCLDTDFVEQILNFSGNRISLVAFSSSTDNSRTVNLTTDGLLLNTTIGTSVPYNGYTAGGGTCICCGINSARDQIVGNIKRTTLVAANSEWNYTDDYLFSSPPQEGNNTWYDMIYNNETAWLSGNAILGATNGFLYTPFVNTELKNNLSLEKITYVNMWEHDNDLLGAPNDFSGGILNSTANTFGLGSGNDGWDWDPQDNTGPFGYDDNIDYNSIVAGRITLDTQVSGSNICSNRDCSGAYGVTVTITNEVFTAISNGAIAQLSFDYDWDGNDNPFESSDNVWIKSYWESPTTGIHYLGSEQSSEGGDTTIEIDYRTNPDTEFFGSFSQVIGEWVEGPGDYYFVIGGKLLASSNNEWGTFAFDNIQLEIREFQTDLVYVNLWEGSSDLVGPPNDFSGGILNTTGNTYGISGANDGWDWDGEDGTGVYGNDDDIDYAIVSGKIQMDNADGGSGNTCSGYDCSGSYGILVNITNSMYNLIVNNASAVLSFDYEWEDLSGSLWEIEDQIWFKGKWTSPISGEHYLGSDLDSSQVGGDAENEIYSRDDPDGTYTETFSQDLSGWIEAPGMYYLELGGKALASQSIENGIWKYDNLFIAITNKTNHYYFRKHFNISDTSETRKGLLKILSDDKINVYLNGDLLYEDTSSHIAQNWNAVQTFSGRYFNNGDNVIAVELTNINRAAKFDLEIVALNDSRDKAMIVMTDGVANELCAEQGTGSASEDARVAACQAREDYGIKIYAVGYSDSADEGVLQSIAACGDGIFSKSSNVSQLRSFYNAVVLDISLIRHSQTIEVQGSLPDNELFFDSYINMIYDPVVAPPALGEISVVFEESNFPNCTFNVAIPEQIRITDAKITSYSSKHWTDGLIVNNNTIFNLTDYNSNYTYLGDPFVLNIPPSELAANNTITLATGDSSYNYTGCSKNNTFFYNGMITALSSLENVSSKADGCNWTIEFLDGISSNILVPIDHDGVKKCFFTSSTVQYDVNDTFDVNVFNLLNSLDFDDDNISDISFSANNEIFIDSYLFSDVPSMWGPTVSKIEVWQ